MFVRSPASAKAPAGKPQTLRRTSRRPLGLPAGSREPEAGSREPEALFGTRPRFANLAHFVQERAGPGAGGAALVARRL
jgi:hypothetical protein